MTDNAADVFGKVSFVEKISIILKATSDDGSPIPGHLYTDINNITLESDGYCESTLEYLVDRLGKKSCHVKLKVMKIMKHLVKNGNPNFRLGLIKSSQGITEAKKYSGPPDPIHGNVPYLVVRKTAKELLEILFDTENITTTPETPHRSTTSDTPHRSTTSSNSNNIALQGLGSTTAKSTSKMEGFGNSPSPRKGIRTSLMENISDFAQSITEEPENQQRAILSTLEKPGSYTPPIAHYHTPVDPLQNSKAIKTRDVSHIPGRAGGGWEDEDEDDQGESLSSDRQSGSSSEVTSSLESGTIEDAWTVEESLLTSTVDTGQGSLLTNGQISQFIKSCQDCNCDKVLELLNQRLQSTDSCVVMRALLLIENFLRTEIYSTEHVTSLCSQNLFSISRGQSGPITTKAKKILHILDKLRPSLVASILTDHMTKV